MTIAPGQPITASDIGGIQSTANAALPKAGGIMTGNIGYAVQNGVVAAGTNQATATLIQGQTVRVTSVPSGTGVILDVDLVERRIYNRGANPLNVYPPVGAQIENFGTNIPTVIPAGSSTVIHLLTSTIAVIS